MGAISSFIFFITGLLACLFAPVGSYSQYRGEKVFWANGTIGYYQNNEGVVFSRVFPAEREITALSADKLMPEGTEKPLHLLFAVNLPDQGAMLIFSDEKIGESYNNQDSFWSYQIKSRKLSPIRKPLPNNISGYANIYSLYEKGDYYLDNHKPDSAAIVLQLGLKLSQSLNDAYLEAKGLYRQCRRFINANAMDSAQQALDKALYIFEQLGMQKDIAACYIYYCRIYQRVGDFPEALNYGLRALRINEALKYNPGISRAYNLVGNVYLRTRNLDEALSNFSRALAIDSVMNNRAWIAGDLLNMGAVYQKKRNQEMALDRYRSALNISRQLGDKATQRVLLTNIGSTLRAKGKLDSSILYLNKALVIARKYNIERAHLLNDIVETCLKLDKPEAAKNYAILATKAAEREQNLDQLQYAWLMLSRTHEALGDYHSAYNAMAKYAILKDSLLNKEKIRVLNHLKIKYGSEKKEQVITQLTQEKAAARFRRNTYLVSGILVAIILLLLFNRQRMKSRKNRILYEKKKELEQIKTTFFSNISHEFRTPLTLILGPIHSLREATDNSQIVRQLNTMEHNAQRLLSLIDQLLYLSKLESGKLELSHSRQDIGTLIRGNVMNFSSLAASRKIDLSVNTSFGSLVMDFDKEKMETIFINLLSNAFKFTPDGGSIHVSVEIAEQKDEDILVVHVRDSGAGIAEKDIPYVFDRYYQGEEGQKSFRAGSGIGLAMVKELVQLHRGAIEIFSKPGEGTALKISIPMGRDYALQELARNEDNVTPEETDPLVAEETVASEQGDKEKPIVLVIEDNTDVMQYIKDVLQKDYTVLSAADGEAGVVKALEVIPDLIISDVMMPKKDGYEVCDILRQDERTSHVPLILLTARADHEDKLHGLRKKADEYLTKPFYPKELLLRTGNLISSRRTMQEKYRKELILKPMGITAPSMEEAFLQRLMQVVEEQMDKEDFTVTCLAREIGMSRSQLHRKLHALTNQSATEFIRYYRLTRAMEMLQHHVGSVAEVGYTVGFSSSSYFNKMFLQQYGITPGQARAIQG